MLNKETILLLEAIAETYKENIQKELIRIGLEDSNIINSIDYKINDYQIEMIIPDYAKYIESGRFPGTTPVPIPALIKWMIRKKIAVGKESQIAFAIRESIFQNGIQPRPFLDNAKEQTDKEVESLLFTNFESIITEKIMKQL